MPKIVVSSLTRYCLSLNRCHPSPAPVITTFVIFTFDFTTATTIATSLVHSRLDYCNSIYYGLSITQIKRLQYTHNGLARAVTRTPRYFYITPLLQSLHWLKVEQWILYKIISIIHNLLHVTEPKYLRRQIYIKPSGRSRSSDHLCLSLPPVSARLKFADRSFRNSSPHLSNYLPINLRYFAPGKHYSTPVISSTPSHPFKALLSSAINFFHALKSTCSLFSTSTILCLPVLSCSFPTGKF